MFFLHRSENDHQRTGLGTMASLAAGGVLSALVIAGSSGVAQADRFEGLWRGSGYVNPAEGQQERVRCRVVYTRIGDRRYGVTARCATQAVNIDQVGEVRQTGGSSFSGTFYNAEYNVRGRIRVRVSGNRQSVTLSSPQGSGRLTLFKR
jgi:hypothetical protein